MLLTFKSAASADVIMFGEVAGRLLEIIGRSPDDTKGILTVEQLDEAIARLRAAIDADKQRQAQQPDDDLEDEADRPTGMAAPVSLAQRAYPLLEMLQYAQRDKVPVVWGV